MKIKVSLQQITSGKEYTGKIEGIGEEIIEYNLSFGVPINQLDSQNFPKDEEEMFKFSKHLFGFTVNKSGKPIELSKELFGFMVGTAGKTAISFYNNPQTEDYNSGNNILSSAVRNDEKNILGLFGATVSIGMSASYNIPEEAIPDALR